MNNKIFLITGLLVLSLGVFGQEKDEIQLKYANTIKSDDIRVHLNILASDSLEGRETGEKGLDMAADYISSQFKSFGIPAKNGSDYLQHYSLENRKYEDVSIYEKNENVLSTNHFKLLEDFYFFGTFDNVTIKSSKICFVGYGISEDKYDDYKDIDVKGKIVVMFLGEPKTGKKKKIIYGLSGSDKKSMWSHSRQVKLNLAKEKGAVAVFFVRENVDEKLKDMGDYFTDHNRMNVKNGVEFKGTIPNFFTSDEMCNNLMRLKLKGLKKKIDKKFEPQSIVVKNNVHIDIERKTEELQSKNVYAYIEGGDLKDELLVITAHYDHIGIEDDTIVYNGADDNGSGTSALLEMAQAFQQAKKDGNGTRRSVLVMLVSGEEKGLLGSQYYSENPVIPLKNTVAALNIDMIGRIDDAHEGNANYVYLIGTDRLSNELHVLSETANTTYSNLELDYKYNAEDDPERIYFRSDHYNFAKHNIPVIFYFNGVHDDYHRPSDTIDKIDFDKIEKITRLVFHTAWEIANRDERLKLKEGIE